VRGKPRGAEKLPGNDSHGTLSRLSWGIRSDSVRVLDGTAFPFGVNFLQKSIALEKATRRMAVDGSGRGFSSRETGGASFKQNEASPGMLGNRARLRVSGRRREEVGLAFIARAGCRGLDGGKPLDRPSEVVGERSGSPTAARNESRPNGGGPVPDLEANSRRSRGAVPSPLAGFWSSRPRSRFSTRRSNQDADRGTAGLAGGNDSAIPASSEPKGAFATVEGRGSRGPATFRGPVSPR